MTYACAHCGAFSTTDDELIQDGTTWRCKSCSELTVVRLWRKAKPRVIKSWRLTSPKTRREWKKEP